MNLKILSGPIEQVTREALEYFPDAHQVIGVFHYTPEKMDVVPKEKVEKPVTPKKTEPVEEEKITLDKILTVAKKLARSSEGRSQLRAILDEFECDKVSNLSEKSYPSFYERIKEAADGS